MSGPTPSGSGLDHDRHTEVIRAVGILSTKVDQIIDAVGKHDDRLETLESIRIAQLESQVAADKNSRAHWTRWIAATLTTAGLAGVGGLVGHFWK